MTDNAIEVHELTKRFGAFTAVDNISFSVKRGEIFGFLGANGAGKSTTIRMLCGLLLPSEGRATVGGFDVARETDALKKNIGYMSQRFSLYDDLTVEENIRFYGGVYGLAGKKLSERMKWVIEMAGLTGRETSLTKTLAGGWKQRLSLGCAILHEPRILFLDEPTGSVDPISRRNFWELINTLSDEGVSVLVTTHYLDEAEYCNDITLIDAGRIIASGSPKELKREYIRFPIIETETSNPTLAMKILEHAPWVKKLSLFGTRLHVGVEEEVRGKELLRDILSKESISIIGMEKILPSLEDVFLHLLEEKKQGV